MPTRWCVKVRRYAGGESVMWLFPTEREAAECAAQVNRQYQTDAYFVEEWRREADQV